MPQAVADALLKAARRLHEACVAMRFGPPVTHAYHPWGYAWPLFEQYARRYATRGVESLWLGMNPGPWGMAQTGVPFGEVAAVRDWLGLDGAVGRPDDEHPKRPVQGLACPRSEVSGRRVWGLLAERFATPGAALRTCFVLNYCPVVLMEETGRNRTPDKLPKAERDPLEAACDRWLRDAMEVLVPSRVVAVGHFAERRAHAVLGDDAVPILRIAHPSPASPAANRGWATLVDRSLGDEAWWPSPALSDSLRRRASPGV